MNYIKMLEIEQYNAKAKEASAIEMINRFRAHLVSEKFRCGSDLDGYISTKDVDTFLTNLKGHLWGLA